MTAPSLNPRKLSKASSRQTGRKPSDARAKSRRTSEVFFIDASGEVHFDPTSLKSRVRSGSVSLLRKLADELNCLFGKGALDEEMIGLEASNLARRAELKRRLLLEAITVNEVANLLGTTRQTPHDRVTAGTLLAVKDKGQLWFPMWQFDPEAPDRIVQGLPEVLQALAVPDVAKANWLTAANAIFEGRSPLEALKAGEVVRVVTGARAVGAAAN